VGRGRGPILISVLILAVIFTFALMLWS